MVAHVVGDDRNAKTVTAKLATAPKLKEKKTQPSMITRMLGKAKLI